MKKGIAILSTIIGVGLGVSTSGYLVGKEVKKKNAKVDKFRTYYNMLNQWLALKQENRNLSEYFNGNNYKTIAIYGMGEIGTRLFAELKDSDIEVVCAIDKDVSNTYTELNVIDPEDSIPEVDVIVVTAAFAFEEIVGNLKNKINVPIVSIEDVLYEI